MSINEMQQRVINENKNNILLLASAGTGKTNTLSNRVANIIKNNIASPSEILCITFTNKACKEMRDRVEAIISKDAKDITIKTFHSFCFDIIKIQAKKRTDIFTDFVIFDEDDCKELIKTCNYFNFPISLLQNFIKEVKIEKAKDNYISKNIQDDYKKIIENLYKNQDKINNICSEKGKLNVPLKEELARSGLMLLNTYNTLLINNHGVDFDDLILKTKELFNDEEVVNALRSRYKFINIDEVQDTSTLEYSIIEKLFEGNNILVCGDIFQTIYSWRGSEPLKIFNTFKDKYKPFEIVFSKNYRATKNLTEASLNYLKNAFPDIVNNIYKDGITAESSIAGEKIKLLINNNGREEARVIFDEIIKLEKSDEDLSKICILTRDNGYNINLSKHLKEIGGYEGMNFEFILVDQFKFFRRQEIKDIIAFLKLIVNRYDSLSLKRIVDRLPTGIGDKTFEAISSKEYKKVGIALTDYINPDVIRNGEIYSTLIKEFQNNNVIVFDVESTGIDVTEDEIIQIAAIKINKNGEVIGSFEKLLKNKKSVKDSVNVHGFSDEILLKKGENKEQVFNEFLKFSKDAVIVGHNVQYDINILSSELSRLGLDKPKFKTFYDTLDIYRRFYPNLFNHKLETLSKVFKTNHKPTHDAMDDILATSELLVKAINEDIKPTSMERMAYMTNHLKAFTTISNKLNELFIKAEELRPCDIVVEIINAFNIKSLYTGTGNEGKEKIDRLRDFYVLLKDLDDTNKNNRDSLLDIVKITGLSNGELESLIINRTKKPRIPIITVHQAKGLEYDTVFIAGAQQNTFPSYMSLKNYNLEEEKRLFYVAITRAKKNLFITSNTSGYFGKNEKSILLSFIANNYFR